MTVAGLASFPGWHEETDRETGSIVDVKLLPSRQVSRICAACITLSTLSSLTAATWQHVAAISSASVVEYAFHKGWNTEVGWVAAGLVWASFFMNAVVMLGLIIMKYLLTVVDDLTDG
jgi:hypothetical protein